jgi:hypothetical protein
MEGVDHSPLEILSWHLSRGTEESQEKPQSRWAVPGRNLKSVTFEGKKGYYLLEYEFWSV